MNDRKSLADLVSHDGLHDALTGLTSFPAFMESATREIALSIREKAPLNLFLISISELHNESGNWTVLDRSSENLSFKGEDLYRLAAQIIYIAGILQNEFRQSDLLARYTLTEFLLMTNGEHGAIMKKLKFLGEQRGLTMVGTQILFPDDVSISQDARKILLSSISTLHEKIQKQISL